MANKKLDTFRSGLVSDLIGKRKQAKKEQENSNIWNSEKIKEAQAMMSIGKRHSIGSPYMDNIIGIRRSNIVYEYTEEEKSEMLKCAQNVKYFAEKYCQIKNEGIYGHFTLRDYQKDVLDLIQESERTVLKMSRQLGKTVMTAISLLHYVCFNIDKKVLMLANKGETVQEVMDKIKEIYLRLPFFLQPGVDEWNKLAVSFDNGCALKATRTTKNPGIGFTVDFLYIDECAHIEDSIIRRIWGSLLPTLDANPNSKMVVSSTPFGKNFFWEIWQGAQKGTSGFAWKEAYWWQVPGRDEEWKDKVIMKLGNGDYEKGLEIFTREYDCLFVTDSTLLLDKETLTKLKENSSAYKHQVIEEFEDLELDYHNLVWSDRWDEITKDLNDRYWLLSIDLGKGLQKDYTVVSIFEITHMTEDEIKGVKNPKSEFQFLKFKQTGMFRSNQTDTGIVAHLVMEIVKFLGIETTLINFEANQGGDYFFKSLQDDEEFYEDLVIHSLHRKDSKISKPGILITSDNKVNYCKDLKKMIRFNQVEINEPDTIEEFESFGVNKNRTSFEAQSGNDDIVMSMVNMAPIYNSFTFEEMASDIIDSYEKPLLDLIYKQLSISDQGSEFDYSSIFQNQTSQTIIPDGFGPKLSSSNSWKFGKG